MRSHFSHVNSILQISLKILVFTTTVHSSYVTNNTILGSFWEFPLWNSLKKENLKGIADDIILWYNQVCNRARYQWAQVVYVVWRSSHNKIWLWEDVSPDMWGRPGNQAIVSDHNQVCTREWYQGTWCR